MPLRAIAAGIAAAAAVASCLPPAAASAASRPGALGVGSRDDFELVPFATHATAAVTFVKTSAVVPSTGRSYTRYVSAVDPRYLTAELPAKTGCEELVHATAIAQEHGCTVATNGAFFDMHTGKLNHCIGNVASNGTQVQLPGGDGANFGIVRSKGSVLVGFASAKALRDEPVSDVLQGRGWLVRNGQDWVRKSPDLNTSSTFVTEKAPRTAVGVFPNGTAALVVVDGAETIRAGLDLFEFAEVLAAQVGVQHAVNIDGGGSSVAVVNGKIASKPTCVDTPSPICERAMPTIMCARGTLV